MIKIFAKEALEGFKKPKNAGELKDCYAIGKSGDPECSDILEIYIKFEHDKIIDAKFMVFEYPEAVSTTNVCINIIKGKLLKKQ